MSAARDPAFERLLEHLRDRRGFDYTDYKRPSLVRRIEKRMDDVGSEDYDGYCEYLDENPDEYAELFNTILINVTAFFRDREAWDFVADEIVPQIAEATDGHTIRVWSAGTASGEEAYTAAMLFCEALGEEAFRARLKIYATDIDDDALAQGRHASYLERSLESVPGDFRDRYFQPVDDRFTLRSDIRRAVVFGRNDILRDPPISRVSLLISRNTLMYFERPAQDKILANFHYALRREGFLFLGKAEALQTRHELFTPLDLRRRIFVKAEASGAERRQVAPAPARAEEGEGSMEAGFELSPVAQIVIDATGALSAVNQHARDLFGLSIRDLGRPLQDLELSYRPLELRSRVEEAYRARQPVSVRDVVWAGSGGNLHHLDVHFAPVFAPDGSPGGIGVAFTDISRYRVLREEVESAQREAATAYEELQSTVEELETTNEELQSTNEELETTNEELQSTNEELETMNEELQSTNEELETMNDEMRDRTDEALRASAFLTSVLESIQQSVIVVDSELRVARWSAAAVEHWGLRPDEAEGDHIMNLDIGLPVAELRDPIRRALAGSEQESVELTARNRRGQDVQTSTTLAPISGPETEVVGVILLTRIEPAGS